LEWRIEVCFAPDEQIEPFLDQWEKVEPDGSLKSLDGFLSGGQPQLKAVLGIFS
jgi:hypothetical protein